MRRGDICSCRVEGILYIFEVAASSASVVLPVTGSVITEYEVPTFPEAFPASECNHVLEGSTYGKIFNSTKGV